MKQEPPIREPLTLNYAHSREDHKTHDRLSLLIIGGWLLLIVLWMFGGGAALMRLCHRFL